MKYNHFTDREFYQSLEEHEINDVIFSDTLRDNRDELRAILNTIRDALGQPIIITSWYRDAMHNKKAGGVQNSQHLDGSAVDISARNNALLLSTIQSLCKHGLLELGQVISYGRTSIRFIHISLPTRGKVNQFLQYD